MSGYLTPEFALRLTPGISPTVITGCCELPRRELAPTSLPPSFLFTDSVNASTFTSDGGRYIAHVSGEFDWDRTVPQPASRAKAMLDGFLNEGIEHFVNLTGSWRAVIIDNEESLSWVAIDRMGSHRVCFRHEADGTVLLADSGELVAALSPEPAGIDPTSLFHYFFFHCIPSPSTVFRGVRSLGPAGCLQIGKRINEGKYWTPDFYSRGSTRLPPEGLFESLRESITRSVPNEPVGAFLSGGLDSSTVVGMAAETAGPRLHAYTIGFNEPGYDETAFAKIAAKRFHVPISIYDVTPDDILDTIDIVAKHFDEPFGNSSAIPTYHCAALAAGDGQNILLAGDGGDELYAGNERYRTQQIFSWYERIPAPLRRSVFEPLLLRLLAGVAFFPIRKARRYVEQATVRMPDRLQTYNFLLRDGLDTIFTDAFLDAIDPEAPLEHMRAIWDEASECDFIDRMLYLDWKLTLADNDLRKVSTMCRAAGVRVVYPMLSNTLIDAACSIPGPDKMRRGKLRGFYKEATKGFLPDEILTKSKHGFGLPFGPWFKKSGTLRDSMMERLNNLASRDIVRTEYIEEMCRATVSDHAGYFGEMIWVMSILESWLSARPEHSAYRM